MGRQRGSHSSGACGCRTCLLTRHIHSKPESNQWILQSLLALTLAPRMGEWIPTAYIQYVSAPA